jgi:hypothetical protein
VRPTSPPSQKTFGLSITRLRFPAQADFGVVDHTATVLQSLPDAWPRLSSLTILEGYTPKDLPSSSPRLSHLTRLIFGPKFNGAVEHVVWPEEMEWLEFGEGFDQPILPTD